MPNLRLVLFIDYQNAYNGAREAFFPQGSFHTCGQFYPDRVGQDIASRQVTRDRRVLQQVRLYTGSPASNRDQKGYAAHRRQSAFWTKTGVHVVHRTLRYPRGWPKSGGRAQEKGIDVALAIDFVMMHLRNEYDVGVILSSDTDLLPALEAVTELAQASNRPLPEVAAWGQERQGRSRLRVKGVELRCHWLDQPRYNAASDRTDYNIRPQA